MGQCMSRKAAGAFAASAAVSHNRPSKMQRHQYQSPDDENNKPRSPVDSNKRMAHSKGVSMSFGFRRRPMTAPSIASNANAARRLANADVIDRNGNEHTDTDALTSNVAPTGRSTPRLAPPKKEPNATRVSRFGFRQGQGSRLNKVADLNSSNPAEFGIQNGNNNAAKRTISVGRNASTGQENNRARATIKVGIPQPQVGRFTLQSTNLPRPEPIRVIETKTAKTLANNNRRVAGMYQQHVEDSSSKDGSLTEDSGVGSHISGYMGDTDSVPQVERLESSPTFGARRRSIQQKPRNLEMVVTSNNTFDVKDLEDSNGSCDSIPPPPLPQLPSAFNSSDNKKSSYQSSGLVRERAVEYQRHLERDNRGRKISATSSEGFSDDYGEEEKTYKERFRSEKTFIKATPHKTFLKSRTNEIKEDSSPPSSDEHEWVHGGEAMADEISFSLSSSDESKDKNQEESVPISAAVIGSALQSLMTGSLSKSFTTTASNEVKSVLLTIEDPKFAAVAAASNTSSLLDEETLLSPADSIISCSETEEIKRKHDRSSSNSKDINEKLTPPSPGTPTNASHSLSLSDGKDDFLIDDEIADQPALVFEDTITAPNDTFNVTVSQNNSESTPTIVDSTPKQKRRVLPALEGSPLSVRSKKFLQSRTGSLDTLSPCESIASDDLMMDYEYSQSSGLEDCDRQSSGFPSFNDTTMMKVDSTLDCSKPAKDWIFSGNFIPNEQALKCNTSRPRLLRSRTGTPNSVPDSPRSLDGRTARLSRPSAASSPIKPRINHLSSTGYDSDDSIRLDRANHTAMKQDIISIKTMLLKLRRVLNESETHNPFESQAALTNGLFNSLCPSDTEATQNDDNESEARLELAELRRQVLFLQGQLEDKEKTVQSLQEQMIKLANDNYHSNSAPASTISHESQMCNAATQTERIRPISAGPSLLNGSSVDGSAGSLVSASETPTPRKSRQPVQSDPPASKRTPSRLWRQPGEPPSPQRYSINSSSIPRRANSRNRMPASTPS
ncbi:uncharacterized protein LOC108917117 isoform X3 [Anoplophora glabripennis]|nr:uncharacterized protein LOC108917117 isoform X3 [Anoplophora glabripennis]